jgi:DUF1680 family protein
MNALTGNAEYMDVLERSLYNGALDGLSLSGDRFFYGNPLASRGQHQRREWFGTACCPANIARLVASLGDYIYAKTDNSIYVNLFVGSNTMIPLKNGNVEVKMETNYPWDGNVKLQISSAKKMRYALRIRIPGWANGIPAPGDLYYLSDWSKYQQTINLNGERINYRIENGYAVIDREWAKADIIEMRIEMAKILITARPELKQDSGKVAIQRGPIVYCIEGADNNGKAWNIIVPANTVFKTIDYKVLDENVKALTADLPVVIVNEDGLSLRTETKKIIAIPYYTWANRGKNEMQVWLPTKIKDVKINY